MNLRFGKCKIEKDVKIAGSSRLKAGQAEDYRLKAKAFYTSLFKDFYFEPINFAKVSHVKGCN